MQTRLRELRILAGLTQRDLSELAGISPSHVGLIEQGRIGDLGSQTAAALARVLGVSLDWLVNGSGPAPDPATVCAAVAAARAAAKADTAEPEKVA